MQMDQFCAVPPLLALYYYSINCSVAMQMDQFCAVPPLLALQFRAVTSCTRNSSFLPSRALRAGPGSENYLNEDFSPSYYY